MGTLQTLDWCAIGLYFCVLAGVAYWVVKRGKKEAADYFLAGRNLSWWIIGASIFASNIGSEHIVGLAGSGAKDGVAMAHYEFHAWCLLVLAWVFVPFYARSLVFTMPEFLERRFSTRSSFPRSPSASSPVAWCSALFSRRSSSPSQGIWWTASGSARSS